MEDKGISNRLWQQCKAGLWDSVKSVFEAWKASIAALNAG